MPTQHKANWEVQTFCSSKKPLAGQMHIYVHIPFCRTFCRYCSFYSVKGLNNRESYIKAVLKEAADKSRFFEDADYKFKEGCHTLYFGGGTPSCLTISQLTELVTGIKDLFSTEFKEFTIEANPNDISLPFAEILKTLGVNRVSLGVQSFVDEHLRWMNRRHTALEAISAVNILRKAGIDNISLDLIFGYSSLTDAQWEYNLKTITGLRPNHISAYQMSIDPGSPLGKQYEKGEYLPPSDEKCAAQYSFLQDYLASKGYGQYEISNFALNEQCRSIHNSSYWRRVPYLGLGPGAHSYRGVERSWNKDNLSAYIRYYTGSGEAGLSLSDISSGEHLSSEDIFDETVMLGLRTTSGVDFEMLKAEYPAFYRKIERQLSLYIAAGKLVPAGDGAMQYAVANGHLFVADNIIRNLFV